MVFVGTLATVSLDAQQLSDGTVYAGQSGAMGYTGDGGKATAAELFSPVGVAIDSKGNLYIADALNNRIRRVAAGTGIITTFAGTGQIGSITPGDKDDGAPATKADIIQPTNVAVDGADDVYIFSFANAPRIQKVTASTGIISTVVPNSLLANYASDLMVVASSGGISMAVDKAGSTIWLAGIGQVLKIDIASGKVTTFPTGSPLYATLTLAPNGDLIFLSVTPPALNPSIERMNADTGAITTVFDSTLPTASGFLLPVALCADSSGNIFFSNLPDSTEGANAIFRIASGTMEISQVVAASSPLGTIVANSLTADKAGNLYFAEADSTVHRLQLATPQPAPAITPGGIVPADSSSSMIESGEWVSIYGTNLATETAAWTGNFPLSLAGTSVTIDGKVAYLSFVSSGQINVQVPSDTAKGAVSVVVMTSGGSAKSTVTLAEFAPSFFLLDAKHVAGIIMRSDGSGAYGGGSYDIVGPTGTSLGYPTVAAKGGDIVELFGTGFGPTNPKVQAGKPFSGAAPTTDKVTILINNKSVTPSFTGLSGPGLYQINLTVPPGLGSGDVSLLSSVGGVQTQKGIVISLQ